VSSALRAAVERAFGTAEATGWSARSLDRVLAGLHLVLDGHPDGQPVRRSALHSTLGVSSGTRAAKVAQVLHDLGLLVEDTTPTMRSWIDRHCDALPAGLGVDVRAWLVVLLEGDPRSRPRSSSTIYGYFGRVRPHLLTWSATRGQLREVTEDDVRAVLHQLRGHRQAQAVEACASTSSVNSSEGFFQL